MPGSAEGKQQERQGRQGEPEQEQQARRDRRLAEDPLKVQAEHERDAVEGDVGREPDQQARGDGL